MATSHAWSNVEEYHVRAYSKSHHVLNLLSRFQSKPGFIDVLESHDVSQEFQGVDFRALAASVPSAWRDPSGLANPPSLPPGPSVEPTVSSLDHSIREHEEEEEDNPEIAD